MNRVHAPEKRSCCPSRQKESVQFAPKGFARRGEDSELDGRRQASPYSDFSFAKVSLFPPVQAKLAAARGGEEQEEDAASSEEWFDEDVGAAEPVQAKPEPNRTGMPDRLKAGIEALSGIDMSDVRVHANSPKPACLNALAYTQGNQIYMGPGQERHLHHEAWHAVQQKEGRVRSTGQMSGVSVNDDKGLEREADTKGIRAEGFIEKSKNKTIPQRNIHLLYPSSNRGKRGISSNHQPNLPPNLRSHYIPTYIKTTTVQCFKDRINPKGFITDLGNYFLEKKFKNECIWLPGNVLQDPPLWSKIDPDKEIKRGTLPRKCYVPSEKFIADCLHTAEEIMSDKILETGHIKSQTKDKKTKFGESKDENWSAANLEAQKNENANPSVGEAYAIVADKPRALGQIECQYHAAAVVAKDGNDRITLEVFGEPNGGERNSEAKYSIYTTDVSNLSETFHGRWCSTFEAKGEQDPITIALCPH